MMSQESNIYEMMEAFFGSTGIRLLCFDSIIQPRSDVPARWKMDDLEQMDFHQVQHHLEELVSQPTQSGNTFETYFTENQFIYNIHTVKIAYAVQCFLMTEPLLLQPFSETQITEICRKRNCSIADKIRLTQMLTSVPIVQWQRINQLGAVLSAICSQFTSTAAQTVHQSLADVNRDFENDQALIHRIQHLTSMRPEANPIGHGMYQKIRKIILAGDIQALPGLERSVNFGDLAFQQLGNLDFLRVVKDYFIFFCTTQFYCALEAGLPYAEMLSILEQLVAEVEQMNHVHEVFTHMKLSLALFTKAVHASHTRHYTRPVLDALAFIRGHYMEKITLDDVAAHARMNPSYLSTLIKKETGLTLTDHVNRARVEASKQELLETNRSVNDIAQSVGFLYQNHFAKVFKKVTGQTPVEFRDRKLLF